MSQSRIAIMVLACALVVSNALWAYNLSFGSTAGTMAHVGCVQSEEISEIYDNVVDPLLGAIESSAKPGATKASVVFGASHAQFLDRRFCVNDERVTSVHRIGLVFNESERLVGATAKLCPSY